MSLVRVVLLCFLLGLASFSLAQEEARFEPADCFFDVPSGADVTCGYVIVPEDHQGDPQDTIRLYTAIYRSSSPNPEPDPIIFLQGGPGGAIVSLLPIFYQSFIAPLTANRDLIVFDQRGTGLSEPPLSCPEYTAFYLDTVARGVVSLTELGELTIEAIDACSERLQAEYGIDPAAYTSAQNAADVAAIAAALGYEQVNLFGGSYGTRLALTVMRDRPDLVRSVVLDGVAPIELNIFEEQASKTQDALDRLFAACTANTACAATYPDLEQVFVDVMAALAEAPLSVALTNPLTGEEIDLTLTPEAFVGAVFFSLQSGSGAATVPQAIYQMREGDTSSLHDSLLVPFLLMDQINIGKFLAVNCHEEVFASSAEAMDASADAYPLLSTYARQTKSGSGQAMLDTCAAWGAKPFDPREGEALRSDIPSLLLSGEFDSATPPKWAEQVATNLRNSTSLVLPGKGHVESPAGGCPVTLISAFFNDPQANLDTSCVDDMPRIVFTGTGEVAEITFVEINDAESGVRGVVPQGWMNVDVGLHVRGLGAADVTLLVTQSAPLTPDELLENVTMGMENVQEVASREANGLTWTLYEGEPVDLGVPAKADFALAQAGDVTLFVALFSDPAERDSLRETVFLPVVDALQAAE